MKRAYRILANTGFLVGALWLTMSAAAAFAQQAETPAGKPPSVTMSLGELQEQVRELGAILRDVREEAARSRAEIQALRHELEATRALLASGAGSPQSPAAQPGAASSSPRAVASGDGISRPSSETPAERLAKLEEEQQLLSAKVDDQYQTKMESGSRYRVRLSGVMLLNVFGNRGSVDNQDLPSLALPRGPLDSGGDFGATVRQTQLGLEVFGPKLGEARTSADVQFDFFGGFPQTLDGVTAGLVRMRTATARLDWPQTSIVMGQDAPFFSPLSPTSLASVGLPAFSYAGNLWTWTPQVRVERRLQLSEDSRIILQGGILDSLTGELPYQGYYRAPQAGERSRQPAYATRIAWTRGPSDRPFVVGVGGYYARQDWGFNRNVDGWAGTADWQLPLGHWVGFSGEFYRGRSLGGLGGGVGRSVVYGGALTNPATSVAGLDSTGGWGQLKVAPTEKWEFNGAFGLDSPFAEDFRYAAVIPAYGSLIARNRSTMVNFIYRPRSNLLFSLEYRRLRTFINDGTSDTADHVNLGIGVLF